MRVYGIQKEINQNKASTALFCAIKSLELLNIKYWLEAGTCLGVVRENRFIPYDLDIDLGVMAMNKSQFNDLVCLFKKQGLILFEIFGNYDHGFEASFIKGEIKLDLFFFYEEDETIWHGAWLDGSMIKLAFTKELFDNLTQMNFQNIIVMTPNPVEKYLEERYGDWRVPRREWDWSKDPKCIVKL